MEQIFYYITYIIAISLQLSAGLLLVGNTNISRKGIIKEYCLNHTAIAFEENGILVDDGNLKNVSSLEIKMDMDFRKEKCSLTPERFAEIAHKIAQEYQK